MERIKLQNLLRFQGVINVRRVQSELVTCHFGCSKFQQRISSSVSLILLLTLIRYFVTSLVFGWFYLSFTFIDSISSTSFFRMDLKKQQIDFVSNSLSRRCLWEVEGLPQRSIHPLTGICGPVKGVFSTHLFGVSQKVGSFGIVVKVRGLIRPCL